jgi:hypothetical protein
MSSARDKEEETLWMPISSRTHPLTFDHKDVVAIDIGRSQNAVIAMEVIERNKERSLLDHLDSLLLTPFM